MIEIDPARDLALSRVIRAPRARVWRAWSDPALLARWWIPAPMSLRVIDMALRPGGPFVTEMCEPGGPFTPHLDACFLEAVPEERITFTTALTGGYRPAADYFIVMTATMTLADHADGTDYRVRVMHRDAGDRARHAELGFEEGWGTCIAQLAALVESA